MLVEVEDRATVTSLLGLSKYTNNNISKKSILKQPHAQHNTNNTNIRLLQTSIDENLSRSFVNSPPNTSTQRINMNQDYSPGRQPHTIRMERPKSAKHNLERLKKSFYLKRNQNRNVTSSSMAGYRPNDEEMMFDETNDNRQDPETDQEIRQRKDQRMMASKSAFAVRPKSARHNLEKYRQDVRSEKQEKFENLKKKHRQNEDLNSVSGSIENMEDFQKNDGMRENIDSLDGLLIREEEGYSSSDEVDSQSSLNDLIPPSFPANNNNKTNNNIKNTSKSRTNTQKQTQQQQTLNRNNNNKQKLLDRRGALGEMNTSEEQSNQTIASINQNTSTNTPNSKEQNFTTFRSIAGTYTTPNNEGNSLLVAQKLKQQHMNTNNLDLDELAAHADTVATNSSSSSSTSSQQLSSTNLTMAGIKEDCLHLNRGEDETVQMGKASLNDLLSQKLLNEWYRNDEEVELTIEKLNDFESQGNREYETVNGVCMSNSNNQGSQSKPLKLKHGGGKNQSQQINKSQQQQIIVLNTSGRNSRFSDFSSISKQKNSVNSINSSHNKASGCGLNAANLSNHQNYLAREKSCNSMDPWTRRNPTLVAQNVLMKHRTELEQLHNTRHNNTSRQKNNTTTSNILTTTDKYLLPDTKYYKKSNNY